MIQETWGCIALAVSHFLAAMLGGAMIVLGIQRGWWNVRRHLLPMATKDSHELR